MISTHTPHAGRDPWKNKLRQHSTYFYSHAPCGARQVSPSTFPSRGEFLLTRPMRGATFMNDPSLSAVSISTHTPHAGRDVIYKRLRFFKTISTHTPHAGRDSTETKWGQALKISTHTPHAGRDFADPSGHFPGSHFYSHAPCGARPGRQKFHPGITGFLLTRPMRGATASTTAINWHGQFLLTRPMRGATYAASYFSPSPSISTHTPHAGRDEQKDT